MSGLLEGKRLLITGVINPASIAFAVARLAQAEGAHIVLTGYARLHVVRHAASLLPRPPQVLKLDVSQPEQLASLAERLRPHLSHIDGILHAIAYAPASALGEHFARTSWPDAAQTLQVSTWSLPALVNALQPLLGQGSSVVGLDFDARVSWPGYAWMGVAKAGLEASTRYLARYLGPLGIRVNLVASGPLRTVASYGDPGFEPIAAAWARAPLGWDTNQAEGVARTCVALLSDWLPVTTGSIVYADGGFHSMGL